AVGAKLGFDRLRQENREAWDDLWRGRVELVGAGRRWQTLADAAFYYMHSSAHASSLFSTSMFGLAYWPNYHYYRGQVMWDIETFAFPTLLLTAPETAAALLDFRRRSADAARRNAAMNGYLGLQFPWAAGPLSGEEAVDNDAYVNMAAAVVLREAAEFADRLGRPEGSRWRAVADHLVIPLEDGLILNHDRFSPRESGLAGATPEALGGLFPFGYE